MKSLGLLSTLIAILAFQNCGKAFKLRLSAPPTVTDSSSLMQASTCNQNAAGFVNVQRLNNREYNNVVRDLTGLNLRPADQFPADPALANFDNNAASLGVDSERAMMYFEAAERVLNEAFSLAKRNIVTCTTNTRTCAEQVINQFGKKAFRRPLKLEEFNRIMRVYDESMAKFPTGLSQSSFDESLKFALHVILISPEFLFRIIESPGPGNVRGLNQYEIGSRLSFMLWGSIPDDRLLDLAAKEILSAELDNEILRMLKDPKAAHLVEAFGERWLGLSRVDFVAPNPALFPNFNDSLRAAMKQETQLFLKDILVDDKSVMELVNAKYSFINNTLAQHYGLPPITSSGFVRVDIGQQRRGILTHASVLAMNSTPSESSIVRRGLWVMTRLLCKNIGSPPAGIPPLEDAPVATTNPRRLLDSHTRNPSCAACHKQIDNFAFGLENFDAIGKWRTNYRNGDTIDSSGQIANQSFYLNPDAYLDQIAAEESFRSCVSQNFITYALGRILTEKDQCAVSRLAKESVKSDRKFSELIKSVTHLEQFKQQVGEAQ